MADFPSGFLWGGATAAHQVEGGNTNNDWWEWEHTDGTPAHEPSGDAIDHFSRYDDDFALIASLGHNAHRLSVEWSRIEPAPGHFSQSSLDHYTRVLESLSRHRLAGVVTLYHKTLPRWFADRGGWLSPVAVEAFGRFASVVADALGDLAPYFCTINEPQIIALFGYATGQNPPGIADFAVADDVTQTLMNAHRQAVAAFRSGAGDPKVGMSLQFAPVEPLRPDDPDDITMADRVRRLLIEEYLDPTSAAGVGDWVGLQYYTRVRIDARRPELIAPPRMGAETTQMGWDVYPAGFGQTLREVATLGLPVIVTENGIATADDGQRQRFLVSHLTELKRAMDDGLDVRGYLHWSAFDNFEWNHGYSPTFGLVGIDRSDGLRRVVRPSAVAFGRLARSGELASLTGDDSEPLQATPSAAL